MTYYLYENTPPQYVMAHYYYPHTRILYFWQKAILYIFGAMLIHFFPTKQVIWALLYTQKSRWPQSIVSHISIIMPPRTPRTPRFWWVGGVFRDKEFDHDNKNITLLEDSNYKMAANMATRMNCFQNQKDAIDELLI